MTQGIRISKAGYGVGTANESDLIYSSEFNSPKVYLQGTASVITTGTSFVSAVTHNLDYYPSYRLYLEQDGKMYGDKGSNGTSIWNTRVGTASIDMQITPAGTYSISYLIFADPAKTTSIPLEPVGAIGIKITNVGTPPTSVDLKDYSLHTNYPTMNILGVGTIVTTGADQLGSVAHNLNFRPAWTGSIEDTSFTPTKWLDLPYVVPFQVNYDVYVDDTYIYAKTLSILGTATRTYKVSLFNKEI